MKKILADSYTKTTEGETVYRPFGKFRNGYIIDESQEQRLRQTSKRFLLAFFLVTMTGFISMSTDAFLWSAGRGSAPSLRTTILIGVFFLLWAIDIVWVVLSVRKIAQAPGARIFLPEKWVFQKRTLVYLAVIGLAYYCCETVMPRLRANVIKLRAEGKSLVKATPTSGENFPAPAKVE